jgi:hypothetical protein
VHEHAREASVRKQVLKNVKNLGVQQGGRGVFSRRGRARQHEDARPDDGADTERSEGPQAQRLLQPMLRLFGFGDQLINGLLGKKLAGQKASLGYKKIWA